MGMAEITKHICDRCKKEIKYFGWTALIKKSIRIKVRKLYNGNHNGCSYSDYDYELCNECTKALGSFLDKYALVEGEKKDNG